MDSNYQNKFKFQNQDGRVNENNTRPYNDDSKDRTNYKYNTYSSNNGGGKNYSKGNFNNDHDYYKNSQGYNKKSDSEYSYNNMQSKPEEKKKPDWNSRYSRAGMNWRFIWEEDKEFIAEHLEQVSKKKTFDSTFLQNTILKVFSKGTEIQHKSDYKTFSEISFNGKLKENIENMGFDQLTPIQKYVIPYILEGNDTMGCAQTGSGKTVAFLAPIVNKMLNDGPPAKDKDLPRGVSAPIALILVPTRELAEQIYKEARKVLHKTGMIVVKAYGGVPLNTQYRDITNGCDIIVATPGRLIDFLKKGLILLDSIQFLVFDEADRMLDMGFEDQLREIVLSSDITPKEKRINLMFSATFDNNIRNIAKMFMNDYFFVSKELDQENTANENIIQCLVHASEKEKVLRLHEILQKINGSVLIFLETKRGVDNLSYFLNKRNYNTTSIHGDKSQDSRQAAINNFSKGEIPILIATDVASRGLDFPNIPYVINYDMPNNIDDYIHRIGRTGRCGNKGTAISFVNENCRLIKDLHKVMKKANQQIPDWFEELYKKSSDSYGFIGKRPYSGKSYGNYGNNTYSNNNYSGFKRDNNSSTPGNNFKSEQGGFKSNWNNREASYNQTSNSNGINFSTMRTFTNSALDNESNYRQDR